MKITKFILALLLALQGANMAFAQESSSLVSQIERMIEENHPSWSLVSKTSSKDGKYVSYKMEIRDVFDRTASGFQCLGKSVNR